MTVPHSIDCDGYRTTHWATVRFIPGGNRGMWRAECSRPDGVATDEPHWQGSLVGPGAKDLAWKEAREHSEEVPCDGRCLAETR